MRKIMDEFEARVFLAEELEKVPTAQEAVKMSAEELRKSLKYALNFKPLRQWLKGEGNKIEFPKARGENKIFELFVYFILEVEDDKYRHFFGNYQLFDEDFQDEMICVLEKMDLDVHNIQSITLEKFLYYAKGWDFS